eukprot:4906477-Amphidinium_carterae.1
MWYCDSTSMTKLIRMGSRLPVPDSSDQNFNHKRRSIVACGFFFMSRRRDILGDIEHLIDLSVTSALICRARSEADSEVHQDQEHSGRSAGSPTAHSGRSVGGRALFSSTCMHGLAGIMPPLAQFHIVEEVSSGVRSQSLVFVLECQAQLQGRPGHLHQAAAEHEHSRDAGLSHGGTSESGQKMLQL